MKYTLSVLTLCCLIVGGAAVVARSKRLNSQQPQSQPVTQRQPATLREKVQRAKEAGRKNVYIPAPIPFYAEVDSLDDALSATTVVVAAPVEKTSILLDTESIVTFYKLKTNDLLSKNDSSSCCGVPSSVPSQLPSLNPDEVYLQVGGGTVTIDGITVHREEEFGGLQLFQQHLFFLSQNSSQPLATVKLGTDGIFKVNKDSSLEAISPSKSSGKENSVHKVKSAIEQDLETLHGNSLTRLKARVKEKQ